MRYLTGFILMMVLFSRPSAAAEAGSFAPISEGIASWYSRNDPGIGIKTANGEVFDDTQATCASWHYPLGSYVKITNLQNGKAVICRVNDRGPKHSLRRSVDLTRTSFRKIADPHKGLTKVAVEYIQRAARKPKKPAAGLKAKSDVSGPAYSGKMRLKKASTPRR